jgi:hypothetical protein
MRRKEGEGKENLWRRCLRVIFYIGGARLQKSRGEMLTWTWCVASRVPPCSICVIKRDAVRPVNVILRDTVASHRTVNK